MYGVWYLLELFLLVAEMVFTRIIFVGGWNGIY